MLELSVGQNFADIFYALLLPMTTADDCKQRGNDHFQKQEYQLAVEAYSEAIVLSPRETSYWLNRCAAYRKLEQWAEAEHDAAQALELDPTNQKAWYGRVVCLQKMGKFSDGLDACETGLL